MRKATSSTLSHFLCSPSREILDSIFKTNHTMHCRKHSGIFDIILNIFSDKYWRTLEKGYSIFAYEYISYLYTGLLVTTQRCNSWFKTCRQKGISAASGRWKLRNLYLVTILGENNEQRRKWAANKNCSRMNEGAQST